MTKSALPQRALPIEDWLLEARYRFGVRVESVALSRAVTLDAAGNAWRLWEILPLAEARAIAPEKLITEAGYPAA